MADFNELKAIIEEAIRENGREEITGDIMQGVLLSIVDKLGDEEINTLYQLIADEVAARQGADNTLQGNIDAEELRAKAAERVNAQAIADEEIRAKAEEQLNARNITAEEVRAKAAEKANADDIDIIEGKIPAQASAQNQLADKQYVDDKVATDTATFRGTYNLVTDLELTILATQEQIATALASKMSALSIVPDNNDYSFVQIPTSDATPTEIARIDRYKFNGNVWAFEYSLNNSGFTAAQWATINSGLVSGDKIKLDALPTNAELTILLNGKEAVSNKVTSISAESTDAQYPSAKAVWTAITAWLSGAMSWTAAQMKQARANLGFGNGDIDSVPTAGSNNVVKSGGVQSELALGAVYDVSAHNNNATFASLSALLSDANLNTLIPTSVRKGGMSIKFVQSSDNKYVQYRLMLSTFTNAQFGNIANWQGVDDVPTAGSNNLVKSGGVQIELALGAVYDVSAKNPTAGPNNNGIWESLSALLSDANLSTLIPTSVRKGGMSIKFKKTIYATYFVTKTDGVEEIPSGGIALESASSIVTGVYNSTELDDFSTLPADIGNSTTYYYAVSGETTTYTTWNIVKWFGQSEKYVQYRLMKTSWSINVNDWQDDDNVMIDSKNLTSSGIAKDGYQLVRHLVNSKYEDGTSAITISGSKDIYDIYPNSIIDVLVQLNAWWGPTEECVSLYDSNFQLVKTFKFNNGTLVGNRYYRIVVNTDDYNDVAYFIVKSAGFLYLDIYRKNIMPSVDYLSDVKLIYNPTTYLSKLTFTNGAYDVALLDDTAIRNIFKLSAADLAVIGSDILYLYCSVPVGQFQGALSVTDGTNSISLKPINYSKFNSYTYKSEVFFVVDISSLSKENGLVFTIANFLGGVVRMFTHKWDYINSVPVAPAKEVKGLYEIYDNFSWTPNAIFPTIYDAINAVKEGGTLILPTGTYPVESFSNSVPFMVINKDITIEGSRDTRIVGGKLISEAEQHDSNADVYVTDINSDEYGYAKNDYFWIYQDGIEDSYTAVVAKEMTEKYRKRTYRLPYCTRLWHVDSIEAVVNATRPSWYVDTTNNKLYFRAVTGSNISQNPIVVARDEFDVAYGHKNNIALYISPLVKDITLRNLKIMYGKLLVGAVGNLIAENVEIIGVTGVSAGLGFTPSAKRARFTRCEVAGCAGDAVSGGSLGGPMGGNDYWSPAKPFVSGVQIVLDSIWIHDNADDGITEHGTFSWQIKDSLIEYNGVSGSTVAGGDSDYINCIFRKNAWNSPERGGFQNMANNDNGHCTLVNCVGIDNYASADFLVRATTGKQSYATFINCKSIQTEDEASISYGYAGINPANVKGFLCDSGSGNHMICSDCTSNRNTPVQKGASSDVKLINGSPLVIE